MPLAVGGASSLATNWWTAQASTIGLFTGSPIVGSGANEITTAGYRRGSFGTNPWNYNEGDGTITNANTVTLGTTSEVSPNITHWAIMDSTGVILWRGRFASQISALANNTAMSFRAGDISLRIPFE